MVTCFTVCVLMEDPEVHLPSVKEMLFVIPDLLVLLKKT